MYSVWGKTHASLANMLTTIRISRNLDTKISLMRHDILHFSHANQACNRQHGSNEITLVPENRSRARCATRVRILAAEPVLQSPCVDWTENRPL